ncbi:MAG: hypothetical protein N3F64_00830 [Nitrososphaeria archaeon]|nr:hypothetical protein [Nitrososphaeria archaeon]
MSKEKKILVLTIISATAVIAFTITSLMNFPPSQNKLTKEFRGTFFVSDAGQSHGGFEYNAEWNATLSIMDKKGVLTLELNIGLGDALKKHKYDITDFSIDSKKISMKIDNSEVVLEFVEKDKIWNGQYDNHYIASWGSEAPPEEVIGKISPTIFPGLAPHYYVELRLKE